MKQTLNIKLREIHTEPAIALQIRWDLSTAVTGYVLYLHILRNCLSRRAWNTESLTKEEFVLHLKNI